MTAPANGHPGSGHEAVKAAVERHDYKAVIVVEDDNVHLNILHDKVTAEELVYILTEIAKEIVVRNGVTEASLEQVNRTTVMHKVQE